MRAYQQAYVQALYGSTAAYYKAQMAAYYGQAGADYYNYGHGSAAAPAWTWADYNYESAAPTWAPPGLTGESGAVVHDMYYVPQEGTNDYGAGEAKAAAWPAEWATAEAAKKGDGVYQ